MYCKQGKAAHQEVLLALRNRPEKQPTIGCLATLRRWVFVGLLMLPMAVSASLNVVAREESGQPSLSFTLDIPVGELLQTYLSPDGRQLAVVLDSEADIQEWRALAAMLVDADPLITGFSTEGLRGGPGIVLELSRPVTIADERIAVLDAMTAQWSVKLAVVSASAVPGQIADAPADLTPTAGREDALAGIEARQRGGVTELTLLGRRNLIAEVVFEQSPDQLVILFPSGQQLGLADALPFVWPERLGEPVLRRRPNGAEALIFDTDGPLDLVGATSELDSGQLLSRTRLLFGADLAPRDGQFAPPTAISIVPGEGLGLRVEGDAAMPVQSFLLADPPRLVVDLLGVSPTAAQAAVAELESQIDLGYVAGLSLSQTRLGSARVRIDLAGDYARGLALDTVPFIQRLSPGQIDIALPESSRLFEGFAGRSEPVTLEAQGLRLTLPDGFADESAPTLGLGSTQLLDEFYGDLDQPDPIGEGERFSLRRALTDALARDPIYQAALAAARAEREALPQALAGYRPQVSLVGRGSVSEQNVQESGTINTGKTEVQAYSYSLEVAQPIIRAPALREIEQARIALEQAEEAEQAARQALILRLAQSYLQVLKALDETELARAELEAIEAQFALAEQRFERGLGTRNELNDARSGLAIARARQIQRQNELDDARLALKEIVGVEVAALEGFRGDFTPSLPFPDNAGPWIRAAEQQNPELRSRLLANRIAQLEVERQQAGRLPTLDLSLSAGRQADDQTLFSDDRQEIDTLQVALEMRMPLYSGGRTTSLITQAQERLTETLQRAEGERRRIERAVRSSFLGVVSTAELMEALQESLAAEETRLQTRIEGLESGVESQIEVLDAYQQYFAVRRDYSEVRLDYLINRLSLQQAVGALDERDLDELDRLLDVY